MTHEPTTNTGKFKNNGQPNSLSHAAHKVILFYFGVLATAIEETYAFVSRVAEGGEKAEREGRRLVNDQMNKLRKASLPANYGRSEPSDSAKNRVILPTKSDIGALDEKITRLSKQIDAIKQPE